jgi:hypothetical protein
LDTSTYDPAGIDQQVVGLSATQTLTNKSISGSQITSAVANATNAVNATTATTATTANTVTTIPALTVDVTSSGSSNGKWVQRGWWRCIQDKCSQERIKFLLAT